MCTQLYKAEHAEQPFISTGIDQELTSSSDDVEGHCSLNLKE